MISPGAPRGPKRAAAGPYRAGLKRPARPSPAWPFASCWAAAGGRRVSAHSCDGPWRGPWRRCALRAAHLPRLRRRPVPNPSGPEGERRPAVAVTGSWGREGGSRTGPTWRSAMDQPASRGNTRARPTKDRSTLYEEITNKIIAELEAGRLPWVQPWASSGVPAPLGMPKNGATGRAYSGINVLILWAAVVEHG